jgi:hypothetical protein
LSPFDAVPFWLTPILRLRAGFRIATVEQAEISKAKKSQIQPMVSECCLVHRALLSADHTSRLTQFKAAIEFANDHVLQIAIPLEKVHEKLNEATNH